MDIAEIKKHIATYTPAMSSAERAKAYASGEEVDHIPFGLLGSNEAFAIMYGFTMAQWREDVHAVIEVLERRHEEYGNTGLGVGLSLRTVGNALGAKLVYPEMGFDRMVQPALESTAELSRIIDNDPFTNPVYLSLLERAHALKDAFPEWGIGTSVAGPFTVAANIVPIEQLLKDSRRKPEVVREILDLAVYHSISWAQMFAKEFGNAPSTIADPVSCADILSVKQYRELSRPAQEKLIAGLTETLGSKPGMHICGKTSPLWPEMHDLPIAFFSVDNCEDLGNAREHMGSLYRLVGNVAPVDVMLNGTVDDVIDACVESLRKGAESPCGYELNTGCQVPIGTPRENMEAFMYAAHVFGAGAQKGKLPRGLDRQE